MCDNFMRLILRVEQAPEGGALGSSKHIGPRVSFWMFRPVRKKCLREGCLQSPRQSIVMGTGPGPK